MSTPNEPDVPVAYDGQGAPLYEHQLMPTDLVTVLAEHEGCTANAGQDNTGSGTTGVDVWSCGLRIPFVDDLDTMERLHLAEAILAAGFGPVRVVEGIAAVRTAQRDRLRDEITPALRARLGRVRALCDEWDVLSKGETPTTRQIREALR